MIERNYVDSNEFKISSTSVIYVIQDIYIHNKMESITCEKKNNTGFFFLWQQNCSGLSGLINRANNTELTVQAYKKGWDIQEETKIQFMKE